MSVLLGPSARPMVCIGGKGAWKLRTIKGIMCSFQWLDLSQEVIVPGQGKTARERRKNNVYGEQINPCMVLLNPRSMARHAYVIPQQMGYLYGHNNGTPTQHLLTAAFGAAEKLGVEMSRSAIRNIIDIIIEGLPDLILMPSEPPDNPDVLVKQAVLGIEMRATMNGHTLIEDVI